jgi:signal transduction histidine kinase
MTDNFRRPNDPEVDQLDAHNEAAELRASRERLVVAADADRRTIERELHEGLQQQLVALSVKLQLARRSADDDGAATKVLLEEMERDIQHALDETARLAERIHPPLLEAGGLLAALRAAAMRTGGHARVEVTAGAAYPPEVAGTVYFCCAEALEHGGAGASVAVREEDGSLTFDVVTEETPPRLELLRDRVNALGGSLTIGSEPRGRTRVSGSVPLSR